MIAELNSTDIGLFVAGSIVIPWLIFITKAMTNLTACQKTIEHRTRSLPKLSEGIAELVEAHAPGPDGVMEWKNPDHRRLASEQLKVLTRIEQGISEQNIKFDMRHKA